jgi:hypothetical protein
MSYIKEIDILADIIKIDENGCEYIVNGNESENDVESENENESEYIENENVNENESKNESEDKNESVNENESEDENETENEDIDMNDYENNVEMIKTDIIGMDDKDNDKNEDKNENEYENEIIDENENESEYINKDEDIDNNKYKDEYINKDENKYIEFKRFMINNVHIFEKIGEFIDLYHYNPNKYEDFAIYDDINKSIYIDINPKSLPNNINDFKYSNYKYNLNMNYVIKNKYLYNICKLWLKYKNNKSEEDNDILEYIYIMIRNLYN